MSDLDPGLLSNDQLKGILKSKGVNFNEQCHRDDLVRLYYRFVQPQPQRVQKPARQVSTSLICLKTSAISLNSKQFQESGASDKKSADHQSGMEVDAPTSTQPQRIILKRTHRTSESSMNKMEIAKPDVGLASHLKRNKQD